MVTTIVSMLLTFGWMWGHRDKSPEKAPQVWTPTYRGAHTQRYIKAVHHYHKKMGLTQDYAFDVRPSHPEFCAWVAPTGVPNMIHFGLSLDCTGRLKPELLALHEVCHVRYAHIFPGIMLSNDQKHEEVRSCMIAYSAKERR